MYVGEKTCSIVAQRKHISQTTPLKTQEGKRDGWPNKFLEIDLPSYRLRVCLGRALENVRSRVARKTRTISFESYSVPDPAMFAHSDHEERS